MRLFLRLLSYLLLLPLISWIVFINLRLYHQPRYKLVEGQGIHAGLQAQLVWLAGALRPAVLANGELTQEAQIRSLALYGLAACDLMQAAPPSSREFSQAQAHADTALARLTGLNQAPATALLAGGASWYGWRSYLLGRKLTAQAASQRSAEELAELQLACDQIVATWQKQGHPYPARASGEAWSVDGVLGAVALGQHEQLAGGRYTSALATWIQQVEARLDDQGLLPHRVSAATGQPESPAQGHDLGLMLVLLADVAPGLAEEQYERYRQHYLSSALGIPLLRQFLRGAEATADPEAGQLWGSIGTVASLAGIRALHRFGAEEEALAIRNLVEGLAMGVNWQGEKRYLLDNWLPFEAWVAWSKGVEASSARRMISQTTWRRNFQLVSGAVGLALLALLVCLHWWTRASGSPPASGQQQTPPPHRQRSITRRQRPDPPQWELPDQA